MKGGLQRARQAYRLRRSSPAPADAAGDAAGAMARSPAGGFGGGPGVQSAGEEAAKELSEAGQNVRQIGNRTFYRRQDRWVDSQVTKAQEANARRIKQFSDEYFKLAETHGRTLSQYLVFDEPVLLLVGDQAYLIEP